MQTATMPTNVTGMGALAGGVSGVPATAMPGGLQSAGMASIELGKKRMRDSNDDLLMVPRLMHEVHFPFIVAGGSGKMALISEKSGRSREKKKLIYIN